MFFWLARPEEMVCKWFVASVIHPPLSRAPWETDRRQGRAARGVKKLITASMLGEFNVVFDYDKTNVMHAATAQSGQSARRNNRQL